MKSLLFISLILTILSGCKKNNNTSTNQLETYIKYKINGQQIEAKGDLPLNFTINEEGVLCYRQLKQNGFLNSFYQFFGAVSPKERISIYIPLDTLEVRSYLMDSTLFASTIGNLSAKHKDTTYRLNRVSDYSKINLTSYNNGRVSGTFECNLSCYDLSSNTFFPAKISEGIFNNVKIYQ